VGFVGVAAFVAAVFRVAARVRPQALAIPEDKGARKRGRRSWFKHALVIGCFAVFAFGSEPVGAAFFGGVVVGIAVIGAPGSLLVTALLYRGLHRTRAVT
jgi:hypothetical protein